MTRASVGDGLLPVDPSVSMTAVALGYLAAFGLGWVSHRAGR